MYVLKRLHKVDNMSWYDTVNPKEWITKADHGETGGVETKIHIPETEARETGGNAEDNEESHTRAEADGGEDSTTNVNFRIPSQY